MSKGTIYGYCRVSTRSQSIDRQVENIKKAYPNIAGKDIFKDCYTGHRLDRPEFEKQLSKVQAGDKIVFDEVSRMSRKARDGFNLYMDLYEKGIDLEFLKQPHINTEKYRVLLKRKQAIRDALEGGIEVSDDVIFAIIEKVSMSNIEQDIKQAFKSAEQEAENIKARTREGQRRAVRRGKKIGGVKGGKLYVKKKEPIKAIIREHSRTFGGNMSDDEVMTLANNLRDGLPGATPVFDGAQEETNKQML